MPNQSTNPMLATQNAPEIAGNDSTRDKDNSRIFVTANEKSELKRDAKDRKPDCESWVPKSMMLATVAPKEATKNNAEAAIRR